MLPKTKRFTRTTFPKGRPDSRRTLSWGTLSFYKGGLQSAVVVSKKALKKAHERNRARRRVYGALARINPQGALIVHLKKESLTASLSEIEGDIQEALKALP